MPPRRRRNEDFRAESGFDANARSVSSAPLFVELVTKLFHGHERIDQHRQLFPEPPDVDVNGARAAGVPVAPDVAEQQIPREDAAAMLEEVLEQQELLGRQLDLLAAVDDRVALRSITTAPS